MRISDWSSDVCSSDLPLFDTFTFQSLPPEDEALRPAIRALAKAAAAPLSADRRARSWQGFDAAFSRKLGEAGFLGLTLPRDYGGGGRRSEEHTSELQSLMRNSYAVFCLKKKNTQK